MSTTTSFAQPLMIALEVMMRDILAQRTTQHPLSPSESLSIGIRHGCFGPTVSRTHSAWASAVAARSPECPLAQASAEMQRNTSFALGVQILLCPPAVRQPRPVGSVLPATDRTTDAASRTAHDNVLRRTRVHRRLPTTARAAMIAWRAHSPSPNAGARKSFGISIEMGRSAGKRE